MVNCRSDTDNSPVHRDLRRHRAGDLAIANAALLMATFEIKSLWDLFLQVFALGIFTRRAHGKGALVGVIASAVVLFLAQRYTRVHFFLYAAVGVLTCLVVGYLASVLIPAARQSLEGLTVYTAGSRQDSAELAAPRPAAQANRRPLMCVMFSRYSCFSFRDSFLKQTSRPF